MWYKEKSHFKINAQKGAKHREFFCFYYLVNPIEDNSSQSKTKRRINANLSKMHTISESSSGVPAFLAKLWRLVEDEETNNLIYWNAVSVYFQYYCLCLCTYIEFWMCAEIANYDWMLSNQKKKKISSISRILRSFDNQINPITNDQSFWSKRVFSHCTSTANSETWSWHAQILLFCGN